MEVLSPRESADTLQTHIPTASPIMNYSGAQASGLTAHMTPPSPIMNSSGAQPSGLAAHISPPSPIINSMRAQASGIPNHISSTSPIMDSMEAQASGIPTHISPTSTIMTSMGAQPSGLLTDISPVSPITNFLGAEASSLSTGLSGATAPADSLQINDRLDLGNIVPDSELRTDGGDFSSSLIDSDSLAPSWLQSESQAGGSSEPPSSSLNVEESCAEQEFTESAQEESPQIDVCINNVVCTFSTRCHLNLRAIALTGYNVELKKAQGMLNMKLRTPSATASIWSSGKITITGASSEDNCKIAARRIARKLQKAGFKVKFSSYRVVNVLGTCSLPFGILLTEFSRANLGTVQYEPELHPGATYQIKDIGATLKIFSTGSLTITAPKVENVQKAVERVFPLVYAFKKPKAKKVDPKELRYIERELEWESSEAEVISDSSDLDLEPGEIPSTKSRKFSTQVPLGYSYAGQYHQSEDFSESDQDDDYGSESDE